jgi:hypothetical protein
MSPVIVKHSGIAIGTASSGCSIGLACGPFDTSFCAAYEASKTSQDDISDATLLAPFVLPLENVAKVRVLIVRATGDSATMLLTSAAGVDQEIPLSGGGMQIFHQPNPDDAFTAIKFIGTNSTVSYFIAGDAS